MPIINVNNIDLNYEQTGEGEAIVFLHGYTGSCRDWSNQVAAASVTYKCIAVDHRGHGKTEAPASEEEYSIKIFSEDVYALLNKLGINRCCLVGHSMGGFMSLQFVLDHPEMVKGLVLVDTSSGDWEMVPGYAEYRAKLDDIARNEGLAAVFEYDCANNEVKIEKYKKHPEFREKDRQKVLNTSVDGYIYVAGTFRKWPPVTDRLGEIKAPTLIFLGEEDTAFINASQIMKDSINQAELIIVPDTGHNPHEETPDIFNEAFLSLLSKINW